VDIHFYLDADHISTEKLAIACAESWSRFGWSPRIHREISSKWASAMVERFGEVADNGQHFTYSIWAKFQAFRDVNAYWVGEIDCFNMGFYPIQAKQYMYTYKDRWQVLTASWNSAFAPAVALHGSESWQRLMDWYNTAEPVRPHLNGDDTIAKQCEFVKPCIASPILGLHAGSHESPLFHVGRNKTTLGLYHA
jgi:hypothetical protein